MISNNKDINIVLAINDQYVGQASALIISIHKNLTQDSSAKINILHSNIKQQHQDIIKNMVKDFKNITELNFIDMKRFTTNEYLCKYMHETQHYISPETYYRLFIPEIFKDCDKVLYLDSDMIVCEDLTDLYNMDIDNFYACGICEPKYFFNWKISNENIKMKDYLAKKLKITDNSYFNAGVLLLNLKELRKDNIQEQCFRFLQENTPLFFQDQDVLNAVCYNKIKFIERKYNMFYEIFTNKKNTIIIHFAGQKKPWNYYKQNEAFEEYWKYFRLTPFYKDEDEKLYLNLKNGYLDKKFIKIIKEKHHYKIMIFFLHITINKRYIDFFKNNKDN